ncbi:MAG: response regulator [Desulfobacteraceae bacterium]|nr:response regulator [Desulfobacteraceae bacterium]
MTHINPDDFIKELQFDIQTKDNLKAKLVLSHIGQVEEKYQQQALLELSRADDKFSMPLIVSVLVSNPEFNDSFPLIRETLFAKVMDSEQVFLNLLIRESMRENRILLSEIAGEMRLESATAALLGILNEDHDEKVLRAAVTALGQIGDLSATTAISEYLYSGNIELIIAAIHALGSMATPTAIQRLWEKLGEEPDLDLIIMDMFAKSQVPAALERLNESLGSHFAHIRIAAKQRLVKIGSKTVPLLMNNLLHHDPDLLIHSLNVLGDIGDESAISAIRKLLHNEPKDPNVRFAAYEALGLLPVAKGAITLAAGLQDPVDNVRSAAANAIDHNYNAVLAAGLKNMIRAGGDGATKIIHTVIDAQCEKIFLDLVKDDTFLAETTNYLLTQAHPDIRKQCIAILEENGKADVARCLTVAQKAEAAPGLKVFAVDDSKMILNIYRSVLHNIGCESRLFEFPAEAIEQVARDVPDVILTDLNMPDISGIDLTRRIREQFDGDKLPIIMVTTQNASHDNDAAYAAGVSDIIHKPFNEQQIREVLSKFVELG